MAGNESGRQIPPGWIIEPSARRWQQRCQRAESGERISFIRRGVVVAALVPISDFEWLETNHPVASGGDGFVMGTADFAAAAIGDVRRGRRTVVLYRGRGVVALAAMVSAGDLMLLEGEGLR